MRWLKPTLILLVTITTLSVPQQARACPFCKEAVESSAETGSPIPESDPFKEARAYNLSIYLMLAMPYLCVATVGFMIYRAFKKAQAQQLAAGTPQAGGEGDLSCPTSSTAAGSWPAP